MPTLVLDAALEGCTAAIIQNGALLAVRHHPGGRGSAALLPQFVHDVLAEARLPAPDLSSIVVTIGPGSFTGIRAALALAHGIALAADILVHGVTLGAAYRAASTTIRPLWIAVDSKRGRIFLDRPGESIVNTSLETLPIPTRPIAIAGDAAIPLASRLAAKGCNVQLLNTTAPTPLGIAAAALTAPLPAQPLYIDPPEARPGPPARPAPR